MINNKGGMENTKFEVFIIWIKALSFTGGNTFHFNSQSHAS